MKQLTVWMLIAAAIAAAMALMAVVAGQRRTNSSKHALQGSVARRMSLFSSLAGASMLCGDRPARRVEMTMSKDDYVQQRASHPKDGPGSALV